MRPPNLFLAVCLATAASLPAAVAQTLDNVSTRPAPAAATSATVVPMLVRYDGVALRSSGGTAPTSGASMTFLIYKDEKGGEPLWIETQNVPVGPTGRYEVYLGSTYSSGLQPALFGTGEARWLEVQIAGETPGPRTLLTSVPYALKAADAATLGGLPASAFALAGTQSATTAKSDAITPDASASNVTTTGGTDLYLPKFSGASTVVNSEIYDTGTSVGIGGIPNSSVRLDVNGAMIMRGNMQVTRTGTATTSKAFPSYGFQFYSNAYNSSSKATDNPYFQLQSEPSGNNTASPSATFNLLFSNNGAAPAETGFYINPNGTVHFASGQTFPGGSGTGIITGVTAGTGLTGGGTSGNVTLKVDTTAVPTLSGTNSFTGSNTFVPSIYEDLDVNIDNTNANAGQISPGLRFGSASGEGISSQRSANAGSTNNQYGLDFYTGYAPRLSIMAGGQVGINSEVSSFLQFYVNSAADYGEIVENNSEYASLTAQNDSTMADATVFQTEGTGECIFDIAANVQCDGGVSGAVSVSKIDHPLDPANKYLVHTSVQSSEMMNMYTGNVTTDGTGHATVALPSWFEAENADFRYQLTVVGQFAQAIVKDKIANGQFTIMTNTPGVEVSWLVTAVRQDAYAKAHPIVAEVAKPAREAGFYMHPELYGQPATKRTAWGRDPRVMRPMGSQRATPRTTTPRVAAPATSVLPRPQAGTAQTTLQSTLDPSIAR